MSKTKHRALYPDDDMETGNDEDRREISIVDKNGKSTTTIKRKPKKEEKPGKILPFDPDE